MAKQNTELHSLGTATRYGMDGPGIESRWETNIFRARPGAYPASYTIGTGSFPGVQQPRCDADHPPHIQHRG
jgi:hypothetical protein